MTEILNLLGNMFIEILALFEKVFTGLDAWDLLFGAFTCYAVYRILLVPIIGGALVGGASDMVSRSVDKELERSVKDE